MRHRTEQEGLTPRELAALTAIAPLTQWELVWDSEMRLWLTAVNCPACGAHLQTEVGALEHFSCSVCDYTWFDPDAPRLLPKPAPL